MSGPDTVIAGLLAPVPGENPAGTDLRYAAVFDKIKLARRTAEDVRKPPAEDTGRQKTPAELRDAETAAWAAVAQLIPDVITRQSKDLQLSIWLLEAWTRVDGFTGATDGLNLLRRLLEQYWSGLFPPLDPDEDDPLAYRTAVLDWIDEKLPTLLKEVPLTDRVSAYSLVHYEGTQAVDTSKKKAFAEAGWPTLEQFDNEMAATSAIVLTAGLEEIRDCQAAVEELEVVCDRLFVRAQPNGEDERLIAFSRVKSVLETCKWVIERAMKRAGITSGTAPAAVAVQETTLPASESVVPPTQSALPPAPATSVFLAPPLDRAAAGRQLRALADFLRSDNPYNPLAYLVARALAFGQLLAYERLSDAHPLPAPPTSLRQKLKTLYTEGNWSDLLPESEQALAVEKQAWLDPHRYSIVAMEKMGGYQLALAAAREQLRCVLTIFPDLGRAELEDGTPTASNDTQEWLRQFASAVQPAVPQPALDAPVRALHAVEAVETDDDRDWQSALALVRTGRTGEAVSLLQERVGAAGSGRDRFIRKLRLAELCLQANTSILAFLILDELARTVDEVRLDNWEERGLLVRVWTALYRCCRQMDGDDAEVKARTREAFARLCRLDPSKAISIESDTQPSKWFRR